MTLALEAKPRRPVLAVVLGEGSVSATQLVEPAAAVECDLVWLVDSSMNTASMARFLNRFGTTVDVAGISEDDAADALRPSKPDGIVAYADKQIPMAAALAGRLGLDYHSSLVTGRLLDKFTQRQALREGCVPVPRFVVVPPRPTPADVDDLVAGVDFPVVLKPRRGMGSTDIVLVRDVAQLHEVLAQREAYRGGPDSSMIIEEYLADADPPLSPGFADYVSVESVVAGGQISHVAVTGRFPPAEPFRETGFFIPCSLAQSQIDDVLGVATIAISALGVRSGCLHTEIKLTPVGARLIEVNGRLGGGVPEMLALAAGVDLFEVSQRVALGEHIVFDNLVPTERVGYLFYVQAPMRASRVVGVEGLDKLGAIPGVELISQNRRAGDEVDWRQGNHGHVFSVLGAARDHDEVLAVKQFIDEKVTITYA
jgi:hypothetical protein